MVTQTTAWFFTHLVTGVAAALAHGHVKGVPPIPNLPHVGGNTSGGAVGQAGDTNRCMLQLHASLAHAPQLPLVDLALGCADGPSSNGGGIGLGQLLLAVDVAGLVGSRVGGL